MIKDKNLKKGKTPSRRKFFKAAAVTGAAAATAVAMPNVAFGAPVTLRCRQLGHQALISSLKWQEIMQKRLATCLVEH